MTNHREQNLIEAMVTADFGVIDGPQSLATEKVIEL